MFHFKDTSPHLVSGRSLPLPLKYALPPCNLKKFQHVPNPICVGLVIPCGQLGIDCIKIKARKYHSIELQSLGEFS